MDMQETAMLQALRHQLADARRQNARMRAALLHDCHICRVCACPERERLLKEAFARQLHTLRARA